uniref:Uncharacterized protein n=1 Tax=Anopheles melas TaxID=34690 RepID=A0A182U8N2_9DIPT
MVLLKKSLVLLLLLLLVLLLLLLLFLLCLMAGTSVIDRGLRVVCAMIRAGAQCRCWLSPTAASGASDVVSITPLSERVVSSGVLRVCVSGSPSAPAACFLDFLPFGLPRKMWIFLPVWRFSCFFTACHWRSSAGVCSSIDSPPSSCTPASGCSFLLSNSSASVAVMTTATDATSICTVLSERAEVHEMQR